MSTKVSYIKQRNDLRYDQIQWHLRQLFRFANKATRTIYISSSTEPRKINIHEKKRLFLVEKDEYIDEMINKNEYNEQDFFVAPCLYFSDAAGRKKKHIESFYGIIVDIDDVHGDAEDHIDMLYGTSFFSEIPEPSYWIASGAGLYAVYLLNHATAQDKSLLELYALIKDRLYDAYKGDDKSRELNHLYRIPGLYNNKSEAESYIIDFHKLKHSDSKRWWISDLADELGYTKEFLKKQREEESFSRVKTALENMDKVFDISVYKHRKKSESSKRSGIYSTSALRVQDIEYLVYSRVNRGESLDGMRNEFLICYALYLYYANYSRLDIKETHDMIADKVAALNKAFRDEMLEGRRVEMAIKYAQISTENLIKNNGKKEFKYIVINGQKVINPKWRFDDEIYFHNTKTLIKRFEVTDEEMEYMQQIAVEDLRKTKTAARRNASKRSARRDSSGRTNKKIEIDNRRLKSMEMRLEGYTVEEIAKALSVSKRTIQRDFEKMRKSFS